MHLNINKTLNLNLLRHESKKSIDGDILLTNDRARGKNEFTP